MLTENNALELRDNARHQLMQIKDIETGVEYLNKVKAIETWAKAEKKDGELQNIIAEQKLRTQRILGDLIKQGQQNGELATRQTARSSVSLTDDRPKTITEIGLTENQSKTFQAIASIPAETFEAFIEEKKQAVDNAVNELTTAGALRLTKNVHVSNNSGNNEWYTPSEFIEAARKTMRAIDLDPASSEIANQIVKAKTYYTEETNGLDKEWFGNVWLNPPYSQPAISDFAAKVIDERKNFDNACVLVNNATETQWLQSLLAVCSAVCFVKGRIKYLNVELEPENTPLQGQVVLYFGSNVELFAENFEGFGLCCRRIERDVQK